MISSPSCSHLLRLCIPVLAAVCLAGCTTTDGTPPSDLGPSVHTYDIPSGLSASEGLLRAVRITWNQPSSDAAKYRIQRSDTKEGPFMTIVEVPPSPAQYADLGTPDQPLKDTATYYYRIIAILKSGQTSQFSQVFEGVTAPPPEPPTPAAPEAHTSRGVRLKWTASPSKEITAYIIDRTPASSPTNFEEIARTPELTYVDGGTAASELRDSVKYLYRIAAINRVKSQSKHVLFEPVTTLPPPQQVKGLVAVSDEIRCVPLKWQPSPEPNVVRYDIYRRERNTDDFTKLTSVHGRKSNSYLDGGRDPGNLADFGSYEYRIRAINDVTSESADSAIVQATTREEPPRVKQVKAIALQPRMVPLSWQVSPDTKVIGYEVWRTGETADLTQIAVIGGRKNTNYVDRGGTQAPDQLGLLKDDTVYKYKIVAFNYGHIRSSASETISVRTKKRPSAPAALKTTTDLPHAVNITWRGNPQPDIVEYEVQFSQESEAMKKLAAVSGQPGRSTFSARHSQLPTASTWRYRIKAIDVDRLESDWSKVVTGRARPLPAPPTELKLTKVKAGITLSWQPPKQPDIREYAVWKKAGFKWIHLATTTKREFTFLDPDLAKPLTISVSTLDKDNLESPRSDPIRIDKDK